MLQHYTPSLFLIKHRKREKGVKIKTSGDYNG